MCSTEVVVSVVMAGDQRRVSATRRGGRSLFPKTGLYLYRYRLRYTRIYGPGGCPHPDLLPRGEGAWIAAFAGMTDKTAG